MALTEIEPKPNSWTEAFAVAKQLLSEKKLTAVALVSEAEYASGRYVATVLEEFSQSMGGVDEALGNLALMAPMLYKNATSFRVIHGKMDFSHPFHTGEGWMFIVVYND